MNLKLAVSKDDDKSCNEELKDIHVWYLSGSSYLME